MVDKRLGSRASSFGMRLLPWLLSHLFYSVSISTSHLTHSTSAPRKVSSRTGSSNRYSDHNNTLSYLQSDFLQVTSCCRRTDVTNLLHILPLVPKLPSAPLSGPVSAMSFGFSVGDFLTAAKLIHDVISCLRNSSNCPYHELVLELYGLQRALHEIEHLKYPPSQQVAVNGIKVAALMCQHPLDEFAQKLRKYESLGVNNGGKLGKRDMVKIWGKKVQWGFSMEEEVAKLRAYLMAHVGSLNMRLITQGL